MVLLILSMRGQTPTPATPAPAPGPSRPLSPAAALGQAAGLRIAAVGRAVDVFVCQNAYGSDAAARPDVLPPAAAPSGAHDEYLSACMSDISGS